MDRWAGLAGLALLRVVLGMDPGDRAQPLDAVLTGHDAHVGELVGQEP
ncbi:MAG: hypothetical protein JWP24_1611 [Marmoricola sp.]|nr:hypothetical protein [Marmoricola sp.]